MDDQRLPLFCCFSPLECLNASLISFLQHHRQRLLVVNLLLCLVCTLHREMHWWWHYRRSFSWTSKSAAFKFVTTNVLTGGAYLLPTCIFIITHVSHLFSCFSINSIIWVHLSSTFLISVFVTLYACLFWLLCFISFHKKRGW